MNFWGSRSHEGFYKTLILVASTLLVIIGLSSTIVSLVFMGIEIDNIANKGRYVNATVVNQNLVTQIKCVGKGGGCHKKVYMQKCFIDIMYGDITYGVTANNCMNNASTIEVWYRNVSIFSAGVDLRPTYSRPLMLLLVVPFAAILIYCTYTTCIVSLFYNGR